MAARIAADAAEQVAQLVLDDVRAEVLVRQAELVEIVLVEKMAERAVADVVQQAGHPQQDLDVAREGTLADASRSDSYSDRSATEPGASRPAHAETAYARRRERPTRRFAIDGSAASAAPTDGR